MYRACWDVRFSYMYTTAILEKTRSENNPLFYVAFCYGMLLLWFSKVKSLTLHAPVVQLYNCVLK